MTSAKSVVALTIETKWISASTVGRILKLVISSKGTYIANFTYWVKLISTIYFELFKSDSKVNMKLGLVK